MTSMSRLQNMHGRSECEYGRSECEYTVTHTACVLSRKKYAGGSAGQTSETRGTLQACSRSYSYPSVFFYPFHLCLGSLFT